MKTKSIILLVILSVGCIHLSLAGNNAKPDSSLGAIASKSIYCSKIGAVDTVILEAINIGAPTYNAGNYMGCYRIYEGASYKILYQYGFTCVRVSEILKTALDKSYENYSDSDKAWIMRRAFDEILGEPTKTK